MKGLRASNLAIEDESTATGACLLRVNVEILAIGKRVAVDGG